MQKYVPIEKRSKKARKELAKAQRATWGPLNPVTRRPEDPKKYNRQKSRREEKHFDDGIFYLQYAPGSRAGCNSLPLPEAVARHKEYLI